MKNAIVCCTLWLFMSFAVIAAPLSITTTDCPATVQDATNYPGCTIEAAGGVPPYSFGVYVPIPISSGSSPVWPPLPEGFVLNSQSGKITSAHVGGMGHYAVRFSVTDSTGSVAYGAVNFSIQGNTAWMASVFPSDSFYRHRIDTLPVDMSPAAPLNCKLGCAKTGILAVFGNLWGGNIPYGEPVISVPFNQPSVPVQTNLYGYLFTSAPIPSYAPIQFTANDTGDRHVIVYKRGGLGSPSVIYEMWNAVYTNANGSGSWVDGSNAMYDPHSYATLLHGYGATASGISLAATLINADEVIGGGTPTVPAGQVVHVAHMVMTSTLPYRVWPAPNGAPSGTGSCSGAAIGQFGLLSQATPPSSCTNSGLYGEVYRLKAQYASNLASISSCFASSPQATIIAKGLAHYGVILDDNGTDGLIGGTPDNRWNDHDLYCLHSITLDMFEPVKTSVLMVEAGSLETAN